MPVLLATQLGDQQLQLRHHRLGAGSARLRLLARGAFGRQRRLQGGDVVGGVLGRARHRPDCRMAPKPGYHSTIG